MVAGLPSPWRRALNSAPLRFTSRAACSAQEAASGAEIRGVAEADATTHLIRAGFKQMIKCSALPPLRRLALAAAAILDRRFLLHAVVPPEEGATLPDRMESVDDRDGRGNRQARCAGALTKAVQQLRFRCAGQRLLGNPGRDLLDIAFMHARFCAMRLGWPDVVAIEAGMFPAERGNMGEQLIGQSLGR